MAARNLRYDWLEQCRTENGYTYIATAHHLNDSVETVLYNLTKGCGISGLHGIPVQNGQVIRPLLFAAKAEITAYAKENDIAFREDTSNATDAYNRNKIRHHVIPVLEQINPDFLHTMQRNIAIFKDVKTLQNETIKNIATNVQDHKNNTIDLIQIKAHSAAKTILYTILQPYGFTGSQIADILNPVTQSGAQFYSPTHIATLNREQVLLSSIQETSPHQEIKIPLKNGEILLGNHTLQIEVHDVPEQFSDNPNGIACFDTDALQPPLIARKWKAGDVFYPLGMHGKKQKLQDYFTNNKFSIPEKQACWIIESAGKICWIVGHRMDERFKVHTNTKKVYAFTWR